MKDSNSNVIIIGNSPSILSHECGKKIDTYDVVIRINNCPTKGFEEYIGDKIDIWATTQNIYHNNFVPEHFHRFCDKYNLKNIGYESMWELQDNGLKTLQIYLDSPVYPKSKKETELLLIQWSHVAIAIFAIRTK